MILIQSQVVAINAKINIQARVAIIVSDRRAGECALRRTRKLKRIAFERKFAVALIAKEQGAAPADDQKILKPLVFKIREQRAGRSVQDANTRFFRNIFECSIATVVVQPVGKSSRLADIEIVETIVVKIACRQAIVSVHIDAARAIHDGAPMVDAIRKMISVRFRSPENLSSN